MFTKFLVLSAKFEEENKQNGCGAVLGESQISGVFCPPHGTGLCQRVQLCKVMQVIIVFRSYALLFSKNSRQMKLSEVHVKKNC